MSLRCARCQSTPHGEVRRPPRRDDAGGAPGAGARGHRACDLVTGKGDKPKVQLLLAKLEWLIRGAVEEDAAIRGLDGRTIDQAILRRRARPLPAPVDDGIALLDVKPDAV